MVIRTLGDIEHKRATTAGKGDGPTATHSPVLAFIISFLLVVGLMVVSGFLWRIATK
jgi:hypothetical protein